MKGAHLLEGIYDKYKNVVPLSVKLAVYASHSCVAIEIFKETCKNEQTVWKIIRTKLVEGVKFFDYKMIQEVLNK